MIVAAGLGLADEAGFALANKLAEALGGVIAGDLGALDVGWITEDQLVGLTGASVAPKLYLALGIDGDTSQFMATQEAGMIVAVQPDPAAPFVPVADYNIIADPAEFAGRAAERADPRLTRPQMLPTNERRTGKQVRRSSISALNALAKAFAVVLELFRGGRHEIASIARTHFDRSSGLFWETDLSAAPAFGSR